VTAIIIEQHVGWPSVCLNFFTLLLNICSSILVLDESETIPKAVGVRSSLFKCLSLSPKLLVANFFSV
jgi:hypothetical protein